MTQLLLSAASPEEVLTAHQAGADVVDLKDPSRGSLGRAHPELLTACLAAIPQDDAAGEGKPPAFSCALGELLAWQAEPERQAAVQAVAGVHYLKLGLAGCRSRPNWAEQWQRARDEWPPSVAAVAVAYADWQAAAAPSTAEVLDLAIEQKAAVLLVDTWAKSGDGLLDFLPIAQLEALGDVTRDAGIALALAGSLTLETAKPLLALQPDFLAVRGGACRGGRHGTLDLDLCRRWRGLVDEFSNR